MSYLPRCEFRQKGGDNPRNDLVNISHKVSTLLSNGGTARTGDNRNNIFLVIDVSERNVGVDVVGKGLITNLLSKLKKRIKRRKRKGTHSGTTITNCTEGNTTDVKWEVNTIK